MRIDITSQLDAVKGAPVLKNHRASRMGPSTVAGAKSCKAVSSKRAWSGDFMELFQNMYDAAIVSGMDGTVVAVNERAEKFFKSENESLMGDSIIHLLVGADETLFSTVLDNLGDDRFTLIQAFCRRRDGTVFPSEVSASLLTLGGTPFTIFFFRDVTLRREAEEQLRTGFNAIQNSGNGIAVADMDWNVLYVNAALRELVDLPEDHGDEFESFRADVYFLDKEQPAAIRCAVLQGYCWSGELKMRTVTGREITTNVSVAPNTNADEELTGMVISMIDVTDQKLAEEQLRLYTKELSLRNEQVEEDLLLAREIEMSLLRSDYPTMPRGVAADDSLVQLYHVYCPSWAVGGDFFSFVPVSDNELGIFLCDVMGHGTRAALVVATIRGLLDQLSCYAADPGTFVTRLNQAFVDIFSGMKDVIYATGVYCVLNVRTRELAYVSAGHISPFIISRSENTVEAFVDLGMDGQCGAIGLFDAMEFEAGHRVLKPNDMLLMYTDGLSEASCGTKEFHESGAMMAAMRRLIHQPPESFLKELYGACKVYKGSDFFDDDVCLLACEIK